MLTKNYVEIHISENQLKQLSINEPNKVEVTKTPHSSSLEISKGNFVEPWVQDPAHDGKAKFLFISLIYKGGPLPAEDEFMLGEKHIAIKYHKYSYLESPVDFWKHAVGFN